MHKLIGAWLLAMVGVLQSGAAQEQETARSDRLTASAKSFVELLEQKDYVSAVKDFDETMTKVMPPEKLEEVWASVETQAGPLKRQVRIQMAKVPKYEIAVVTCQFEKGALDVKVVFDAAGKITGLWFAPSVSADEYQPPPYANKDAFEEQETQVGSEPWALPATLALPRGEGPFAAVVLVHGSGPNDRDETIGPNKPFCDLACGLASRGVAVLRYEKRTKKHALQLAWMKSSLTVKEETIDDALAAVSLLRKTEKVDPQRVFVLGHSLGGMLIPRMGTLDPGIAGFVVFAGTSRPLEDVVLDQMSYIASLDGEVSEAEQARLDEIKEQVARVKDPQLSETTPSADLPLRVHAKYWLDLRGYDPPEVAKRLKQPMLILQGQRDYQVTMEDFQRWRAALSSRENVQFKAYPKCNHLFIEGEGEGKSTPAEFQTSGHVAEVVVEDIAHWIAKP